MGDCDSLYKNLLSGAQCSPELTSELMSPITSLALSLHHATNLSSDTPVKRLSISSDTSEDTSLCFNDSHSSIDASNGAIRGDIGIKGSTIMNTLLSPVISKTPLRFLLRENKENECLIRKAYSLPRCAMGQSPKTPLKEVPSKCNRTLKFISPKEVRTPLKPTMFKENIIAGQSPKQIIKKKSSTLIFSSPKESNKENVVNFSPLSSPKQIIRKKSSTLIFSSPKDSNKENVNLSPLSSPKPLNTSRKFSSLSFTDENSIDMDLLFEDDTPSENQPSGLSSLLSAPIKCSDRSPEFSFLMRRRSSFYKKNRTRKLKDKFYSDISMDKENTPPSSKDGGIMEIENSPVNEPQFFKRPLPPSQVEDPNVCKRRKLDDASPFKTGSPTIPTVTRQISHEPLRSSPKNPQVNKCKLSRSISESHVSIMKALNKSPTTTEKSTGDFSRSIALPIITGGKHPDLPSITSDTLVDLIKGKYKDTINSFKILDCRYPYEYEGGHIKDAVSWHNPQMVLDHLAAQKGSPVIPIENQKHDVLIFHCEFSANRGPKAQRLLREKDRTSSTNYPALHFPEMYLLEGGYKVFYQQYPEMCIPQGYTMMADSKHADDLRHFRSKSKSWANDNRKLKNKSHSSTGLRKLRL